MGRKYHTWHSLQHQTPNNLEDIQQILLVNRAFQPVPRLQYGNHGLETAFTAVSQAIRQGKRIALYADYDVDGTMSCVSWIWFFKAMGFDNYVFYIPDRMKEGYGVHMAAVQHLAQQEKAQLIITMDTGITANQEAAWCKEQGIDFLCTDHHKIQPDKMPDCIILNPKQHPDPSYQDLCGCGVTFVLLRRLGEVFPIAPKVWTDILALTGMATICDVVPLNGVNHRLAQQGVDALLKSERPILNALMKAASLQAKSPDERDIGFRLGPRINAVGRLAHAAEIIRAFTTEEPEHIQDLVLYMTDCNEERKAIQAHIVKEARSMAAPFAQEPILCLGADHWHHGVVGIAASKIAEEFWRPTWLFHEGPTICRGSARTIPGFDVTAAMMAIGHLFHKFGGHAAAGGFSFDTQKKEEVRQALSAYADSQRAQTPHIWQSQITFDCILPWTLAKQALTDRLKTMRPFGHGFKEPLFCIEAPIEEVRFYNDKQTGEPRHTAVKVMRNQRESQKIMFFNEVHEELLHAKSARFLVTVQSDLWQGKPVLNFIGADYEAIH